MPISPTKRIFMIDGHALVYRAYFAFLGRPMVNSKGVDTSAIYGFCKTLFEVILKERPSHLFVAFDPGGKNFRHDMFPAYKANRPETPQVIKDSLPVIKEILRACQIPIVIRERVEADDVIGTLAKRGEEAGFEVYMVTPDKDYGQLVSPHIRMFKPRFQGEGWDTLGVKEICEKYGISKPEQVIDILAIWGDASDNVPGVQGVGEVGARKLVAQYGSAEGIMAHLADLTPKMRERFSASQETMMLSKDLVTIRTHLDIPWEEADYRIRCGGLEALKDLFLTYEFHSLIRLIPRLEPLFACTELAGDAAGIPISDAAAPSANTPYDFPEVSVPVRLETEAQVASLVAKAQQPSCLLGVAAQDRLLVFYCEGVFYTVGETNLAAPLWKATGIQWCGFHLKELENRLLRCDYSLQGDLWDPEVMHYLVNPERSHQKEVLAQQYLHYTVPSVPVQETSLFDVQPAVVFTGNEIKALQEEARMACYLKEALEKELQAVEEWTLYQEVEMPLIRVLARMEFEGVRVDVPLLQAYGNQLRAEALRIEEQIRGYAQDPTLNVSSPKQLGVVLFEKLKLDEKARKGKSQYSTDEETLLDLEDKHPIVRLILDYRSLKKLLSSYIDSIPALIDPRTGRVHTTFNQTVTATGRLSSQKPNLQNIPIRDERGRELRKAFIPRDDQHVLFSADYSQIELRLMAHMSQDADFVAAFRAGQDIHAATAAKIFHCLPSELTPEQRSRAKVANFGILYGISAFGLAGRLRISRSEAKQLIDDYYLHYPTVKAYLDSILQQARAQGYVETLFHRKRYTPDISHSSAAVRSLAARNAINAPIQGTAADIIKIAMVRIDKQFRDLGLQSRMIIQVHDELVFDVYIPEKEQVETIVTTCMEEAVTLSVPLTVSAGFGTNWLEAH